MIKLENIHIYPSPMVNEGRIFRQTLSVTRSGLFSKVTIYGTARSDLPYQEALTDARTIFRLGKCNPGPESPPKARHIAQQIFRHISWSRTVYRHCSHAGVGVINAHSVATLPVCYLLSLKLKAALIYDTHELETQTETSKGVQGRIFELFERALIAKCDAVFVVNESIAEWYRRRRRLKSDPVVVRNIPIASSPSSPINIRRLLSIPQDSRLFIHVGNLVAGRSIHAILDAFSSPKVDAHIVFLGEGPLASLIREHRTSHSNIHLLPPVPSTEVVAYVRGCDVGLCLIEPSCLSYKLSLPNKAFEYIKAGIPFFFTDLPEVGRILGPSFRSWQIENPAPDLAQAIATLSPSVLEKARTDLTEFRLPSWDHEARSMMATYTRLVASRHNNIGDFSAEPEEKVAGQVQ